MITREEYDFFKLIKKEWQKNYIVRDKDKNLYLLKNKPLKSETYCMWCGNKNLEFNILMRKFFDINILKSIKFTDEEAKTIREYIEEYEEYNEVEK